MNGNKRWWLSAAGAFAFALSFAAGARGDGAVSDAEAAKLVGGAECTKDLDPKTCRQIGNGDSGCPANLGCWVFVSGNVIPDGGCFTMSCGSCGTLHYGLFKHCTEPD